MQDLDGRRHERAVDRLLEENAGLVTDFRAWLAEQGLKPKTIRRHARNVEFYVDAYLAETELVPARAGAEYVVPYLGDWFLREAMGASEASIRQNVASFKKFYAFLETRGLVSADDVQNLKDTVKEGMPEWLAALERFDGLGIDDLGFDDAELDASKELWDLLQRCAWDDADPTTRERADEGGLPDMGGAAPEGNGQEPCLLVDASFADLIRSDSELSSIRREHASMPAAERRLAADWIYHAGGAQDIVDAMTGSEPTDSQWISELAALAIDPDYAPAMLTVGSLEYQYGRVDEAMELFLRLTSLPADTEDLTTVIDKAGDFLIDRDDWQNARLLYETARAANADEAVYHAGLGYCAGKTGRLAEAVEHSQRAVDLAPESYDHWNNLGYALIEVGRYDEAEDALQRALVLDTEEVGLTRGNLEYLKTLRRKASGKVAQRS